MSGEIYVPGDPRHTKFVDQLWLIAGLIERSTRYYVTAAHFGRVVAELRAQHGAPANVDPPGALEFGVDPSLLVVNAETDDEGAVNRKNEEWERLAQFRARRDAFVQKSVDEALRAAKQEP